MKVEINLPEVINFIKGIPYLCQVSKIEIDINFFPLSLDGRGLG